MNQSTVHLVHMFMSNLQVVGPFSLGVISLSKKCCVSLLSIVSYFFLRCKVCHICLCFNITEMQKAVNVTFGLFLLPPCANSWPKRLFYAIYFSHSMRMSRLCTQMLGFLTRFYAFFSDPRSLRINCYVFRHVCDIKTFFLQLVSKIAMQ